MSDGRGERLRDTKQGRSPPPSRTRRGGGAYDGVRIRGGPSSRLIYSGAAPRFSSAELTQLHAQSFATLGRAWSGAEFDRLQDDRATRWVEAASRRLDGSGLTLIGMALFRLVLDEAELLTICRHPKLSGQGLGFSLLERVISDAIQSGAASMYLEVAEGNHSARNLYDALGFRKVGRRRSYYRSSTGMAEDALVLRTDFCPG